MNRISIIMGDKRYCIVCGHRMVLIEKSWTDGINYVPPFWDCCVCRAEEILSDYENN
jgi:hypothetical protein